MVTPTKEYTRFGRLWVQIDSDEDSEPDAGSFATSMWQHKQAKLHASGPTCIKKLLTHEALAALHHKQLVQTLTCPIDLSWINHGLQERFEVVIRHQCVLRRCDPSLLFEGATKHRLYQRTVIWRALGCAGVLDDIRRRSGLPTSEHADVDEANRLLLLLCGDIEPNPGPLPPEHSTMMAAQWKIRKYVQRRWHIFSEVDALLLLNQRRRVLPVARMLTTMHIGLWCNFGPGAFPFLLLDTRFAAVFCFFSKGPTLWSQGLQRYMDGHPKQAFSVRQWRAAVESMQNILNTLGPHTWNESFLALLILLSGDVHPNPGPVSRKGKEPVREEKPKVHLHVQRQNREGTGTRSEAAAAVPQGAAAVHGTAASQRKTPKLAIRPRQGRKLDVARPPALDAHGSASSSDEEVESSTRPILTGRHEAGTSQSQTQQQAGRPSERTSPVISERDTAKDKKAARSRDRPARGKRRSDLTSSGLIESVLKMKGELDAAHERARESRESRAPERKPETDEDKAKEKAAKAVTVGSLAEFIPGPVVIPPFYRLERRWVYHVGDPLLAIAEGHTTTEKRARYEQLVLQDMKGEGVLISGLRSAGGDRRLVEHRTASLAPSPVEMYSLRGNVLNGLRYAYRTSHITIPLLAFGVCRKLASGLIGSIITNSAALIDRMTSSTASRSIISMALSACQNGGSLGFFRTCWSALPTLTTLAALGAIGAGFVYGLTRVKLVCPSYVNTVLYKVGSTQSGYDSVKTQGVSVLNSVQQIGIPGDVVDIVRRDSYQVAMESCSGLSGFFTTRAPLLPRTSCEFGQGEFAAFGINQESRLGGLSAFIRTSWNSLSVKLREVNWTAILRTSPRQPAPYYPRILLHARSTPIIPPILADCAQLSQEPELVCSPSIVQPVVSPAVTVVGAHLPVMSLAGTSRSHAAVGTSVVTGAANMWMFRPPRVVSVIPPRTSSAPILQSPESSEGSSSGSASRRPAEW